MTAAMIYKATKSCLLFDSKLGNQMDSIETSGKSKMMKNLRVQEGGSIVLQFPQNLQQVSI